MEKEILISNQITIQILMHFKKYPTREFGIRETLRMLKMKSPSTVSDHITKLTELGLLEKTVSNRYSITVDGIKFHNMQFQVDIPTHYIWGKFVPKYSFLIFFLLTSLILSIIVLISDITHDLLRLTTPVVITIVLVVILREWFFFKRKYEEYLTSIE